MSQPRKIRILLVDDHTIVREGLSALLSNKPDFVIAGEAETGQQAIELALHLRPDIIIMDINIPGLNGIETTRRIMSAAPHMRVLILSMHCKREYISQALRAGAAGYLLKNTASTKLFEAIEQVCSGRSYLSPEISKLVIDDYTRTADKLERIESGQKILTAREREILRLIAEGSSSKQVAAKLSISAKTVDNHRKNIMAKLDIHHTAGLVQYAFANGLLTIEELPRLEE